MKNETDALWDPYAQFETAVLPNGLTVHAAHWPDRPWEAMGFLVHSGAEHDPVGLEGLSHFVEHLVSESVGIPKKDIPAFFEECGGDVELGSTGNSDTRYSFFVPTDKTTLARAFSIFGQMLVSANLEKNIERERQVIIGEFHRQYPFRYQFDLDMRERKAVYAGYWLERMADPLGTPESVARVSSSDLQSHYDRHYTPANLSIVGVGGLRLQEIVEHLSESPFAVIKEGTRTPLPCPVTEIASPSENRYVFEISKHISMDAPVEVGAYRSVAVIPGNINHRIVGRFCNMLSELLRDEVRERRAWTYHIGSTSHNRRHFHEFSINCDGLALRALDEIEDLIESCIASISRREDLFEKAQQRTLSSIFMVDITGKDVRDGATRNLATHQRIISLAEWADDIKRLTMDDVCLLLPWLKPERRWTLITRP